MGYREKAHELAKSLMDTEEYRKLLRAKKDVDSNPELKKKIAEYSKKQSSLFATGDPGRLREQLVNINKELSQLSSNNKAMLFFNAGKEFNTLMAKTYRLINDILDSGMR